MFGKPSTQEIVTKTLIFSMALLLIDKGVITADEIIKIIEEKDLTKLGTLIGKLMGASDDSIKKVIIDTTEQLIEEDN